VEGGWIRGGRGVIVDEYGINYKGDYEMNRGEER
jgi:hypothetical protein